MIIKLLQFINNTLVVLEKYTDKSVTNSCFFK